MAFLDLTGLARYLTRLKEIFASKDKFTRSDDGLVPHPNTVTQTHYLREDGSWQVPPNTTYNAVSTTSSGLAPQLSGNASQYLNGAGNWTTPTGTSYTPAALGFGFGTCSTVEATNEKAVTLANYNLIQGGFIAVRFTYAVGAGATMNVNSKGARNIYHRGDKIASGAINGGDTAVFVYDGNQYQLVAVDPYRTSWLETHSIQDSN